MKKSDIVAGKLCELKDKCMNKITIVKASGMGDNIHSSLLGNVYWNRLKCGSDVSMWRKTRKG